VLWIPAFVGMTTKKPSVREDDGEEEQFCLVSFSVEGEIHWRLRESFRKKQEVTKGKNMAIEEARNGYMA